MSVQPSTAQPTQTQLNFELSEYQHALTTEPELYYRGLAQRGQTLAQLRPLLENFLADRLDFAHFIQEISHLSRSQARQVGAEYGHLNAAGRALLETVHKQASAVNRLNIAQNSLQNALRLPASLDAATQKIESLDQLLQDLAELSGDKQTNKLRSGLVPYLLSFFWSLQSADWPVSTPTLRQTLIDYMLLENQSKATAATSYSRFYLAFNSLSQQLNLGGWELTNFLYWLQLRNQNTARLNLTRKKQRNNPKTASRTRNQQLAKLATLLQPLLQAEIAADLRLEKKQSARLENITFGAPFQKFRLGLWTHNSIFMEGVLFEGFGLIAATEETGAISLRLIEDFLEAERDYSFYAATNTSNLEKAATSQEVLAGEFAVWRELPAKLRGRDLVQHLLISWRKLYRLAYQISAQFENLTLAENPTTEPSLEQADFVYSSTQLAENEPEKKVAETATAYEVAPPSEMSEQSQVDNALEAEVQRLAQMRPILLNSTQTQDLIAYVQERLIIEAGKISEILTHLEAGREVLLYGPPGSGKTRLARLLSGQICSSNPGGTLEAEANNYTLTTATAEWSVYDVIGGIRPGLDNLEQSGKGLSYRFEPGVVARAALACENSLRLNGRPHYLIIDEFNRANQERAFGELFTLLEYRDHPLLSARLLGRPADLYLPQAFRIIGTMNADERNTLFETGLALRRRFAMVEIEVPPPELENRFLPRSVQARLPQLKLLDTSGQHFMEADLNAALETVVEFAAAVRPRSDEAPSAGKQIGTALLIEVLVFCAVATRFYSDPQDALEDAIIANLLPQLERSPAAINRALAALTDKPNLQKLKRVRLALERLKNATEFF